MTGHGQARWGVARRCLLVLGLTMGVFAMHGMGADHAVAMPAHASAMVVGMSEVASMSAPVSPPVTLAAQPAPVGPPHTASQVCLAVLAAVGLLLLTRWHAPVLADPAARRPRAVGWPDVGPPRGRALTLTQLSISRT